MSSLSLRLPESLHKKIRELAQQEDVSINQFIATAVAEKTAALLTVDYLEERARRSDPKLFARLLHRVPDVPPMPGDGLPLSEEQPTKRLQPTKTRKGVKRHARRSRLRS